MGCCKKGNFFARLRHIWATAISAFRTAEGSLHAQKEYIPA